MSANIEIKDIDWKQSSDEEDGRIEIRIPFKPTEGATAKDLAVAVKDLQVVIVTLKDKEYLRWRLHDNVESEVEWAVEDGNTLVLDLEKKSKASWPCLVKVLIPPSDAMLLNEAELDQLLSTEYKPLPSVATQKKAAGLEEEKKDADDEDDIDKLLDDAADEMAAETIPEDPYVSVELKGLADDEREMNAKLKELQEQLERKDEDTDLERAERHIDLLHKMLNVLDEIRKARAEPATVKNFLAAQMLDLRKARLNIGDTAETETEAFANDEERQMLPSDLMKKGLQALQNQEVEEALHFLRLAAIHHNDSTAVALLHRIYSQMGIAARAAYFLLNRALDDSDLDAATNLLCGEMFDRGMRHFPPLMAMAVFFYQRAARAGSVNAMLSLSQIFTRGSCSVSFGAQDVAEGNKREPKFHTWLETACARGAGSAYFVMGSLYLRGEHGKKKDYKQAKFWLDKAMQSQPEIIKRAPQVTAQLEALRVEEGAPESNTGASSKVTVTDVDRTAARPDVSDRLERLDRTTGGAARSMMDPRGSRARGAAAGAGAASKRFWERAAVFSFGSFAVYSVCFPLRMMLLPYFYMAVGSLLEMFSGFGAAPTTRPRMF